MATLPDSDHPELCHRVLVGDPNVVRDIDTPADLR
jgi:hypothetical protein